MCGIVGLYEPAIDETAADRMAAAVRRLRHRGPDAQAVKRFQLRGGLLHLGHARLSVIDLTDAGLQPMASPDDRYVLVFNGEIYNYRELRTELQALGCRFISDSDSEVLLAAWAMWGRDCLPRLMGMFAFGVLDRRDQVLTCVRDAFGIKPLFFVCSSRRVAFASEPRALLSLLPEGPTLNWQRAYDYLAYGDYDSTSATFFQGVSQLPPGHVLRVDLSRPEAARPDRWWSPRIQEARPLSFADAAEQVREYFLDSVRLHLRSDVPLGVALSGGVDSSAIVCAMRHVAPDHPIHTFSYIAGGSTVSEEKWVDLVNTHVAAIPHKVLVDSQDLAVDLDDLIRTQGEPFGSTSLYAQYRVYRLARESGITVTLDGQGADELFAGYEGYPGQRIRSLFETGQPLRAIRFARDWAAWPGRSQMDAARLTAAELASGRLRRALRRVSGRRMIPYGLKKHELVQGGVHIHLPLHRPASASHGRRVVAELAYALTSRGLPGLLRHGDRNSMRFSIESRVPFLTLDQADLLLSLPESYLISDTGETKSVLRAAMRGIVPDAILDRKDKIGFQTPEGEWLRSVSATVRDWLVAGADLPFLDQPAIVSTFDAVMEGRQPYSSQVWRWINFVRWHQQTFV